MPNRCVLCNQEEELARHLFLATGIFWNHVVVLEGILEVFQSQLAVSASARGKGTVGIEFSCN